MQGQITERPKINRKSLETFSNNNLNYVHLYFNSDFSLKFFEENTFAKKQYKNQFTSSNRLI